MQPIKLIDTTERNIVSGGVGHVELAYAAPDAKRASSRSEPHAGDGQGHDLPEVRPDCPSRETTEFVLRVDACPAVDGRLPMPVFVCLAFTSPAMWVTIHELHSSYVAGLVRISTSGRLASGNLSEFNSLAGTQR